MLHWTPWFDSVWAMWWALRMWVVRVGGLFFFFFVFLFFVFFSVFYGFINFFFFFGVLWVYWLVCKVFKRFCSLFGWIACNRATWFFVLQQMIFAVHQLVGTKMVFYRHGMCPCPCSTNVVRRKRSWWSWRKSRPPKRQPLGQLRSVVAYAARLLASGVSFCCFFFF